jgi:ABC-type maltose transport system permease subunit
MAMALLASLPLVVLFLTLQRYFVEGLARSGLK